MNTREDALIVMERLRNEGFEALFAGGCVRDTLLGRTPKDWDIATSAHPHDVKRLFPHFVADGSESRGVIKAIVDSGRVVDIATYRKDGIYLDGRNPEYVQYTSLVSEDARRRDFTVNAMYMTADMRLMDFTDGERDLQAKIIRAVGDPRDRFAEDRLRMMRAIRFSCELDFTMDPSVLSACIKQAKGILDISFERIRDELFLMLATPRAAQGLKWLYGTGLLHYILPEVYWLVGCEQDCMWHPEGDVWEHTVGVLQILCDKDADTETRFAGVLHDIGKREKTQRWVDKEGKDRISHKEHDVLGAEMAALVCNRFRLSRTQSDKIVQLVRWHMKAHQAPDMGRAKLIEWLRSPYIKEQILLQHADTASTGSDKNSLLMFYNHSMEKLQNEITAKPLLTGKDLIEAGFQPGPHFDQIFEFVRKMQDLGNLKTKDEALNAVRSQPTWQS